MSGQARQGKEFCHYPYPSSGYGIVRYGSAAHGKVRQGKEFCHYHWICLRGPVWSGPARWRNVAQREAVHGDGCLKPKNPLLYSSGFFIPRAATAEKGAVVAAPIVIYFPLDEYVETP